jgi:cytolysin-activating lysine-acyltransferase
MMDGRAARCGIDGETSQSPRHKTFMIQDLETLVMPAVLLRQFRLYYEKPPVDAAKGMPAAPAGVVPAPGAEIPVGVVLFARVNEAAAARLDAGAPTLRPGDWQSGPTLRIIDIIAPFGGREEMAVEFGGAVR